MLTYDFYYKAVFKAFLSLTVAKGAVDLVEYLAMLHPVHAVFSRSYWRTVW